MKKKTHQQFVDEIRVKNQQIIVVGTYVNCSTKIEVRCVKCGHSWLAWPESIQKGHGCPVCANNRKKSHMDFVTEMKQYNPYIKIIDEYKTAHTPLKVKCEICGYEWITKASRLLNGARCMNCTKPNTSFMEQFILLALRQVLGTDAVESRNKTAIGMELDIYIPGVRLAIEPGSWFYHKNKVNNTDLVKRQKCAEVGIRLLTIYDTYPLQQEAPFNQDCFVFEGFLNEPGYNRLIRLVKSILLEIGYEKISLEWSQLANKAYEACHYNSNREFLNSLSIVAPDIDPLETYKGNNIPILVHNRNCEHPAWKARPYSLLRGTGCPICGRKKAAKTKVRTNEEFIEELSSINPNIVLISEYIVINKRIHVRCMNCNYEWSPIAYSLLSGKGCPHCSAIESAKHRRNHLKTKTTDQFKKELKRINPKILILGSYKNNKTKIRAKCLICEHEWDVVPASLLNGHGCPICSRKRL